MKKVFFLCMLLAITRAQAQESLRPNLYYEHMNYYNPAVTLTDTAYNHSVSLYGKAKVVNNDLYDRSPALFANYLGRIQDGKGAYQVGLVRDGYSFYSRTALQGGYAYGWRFGKHHSVRLGGRMVFNVDHIHWDKLAAEQVRTGSSLRLSPDFDLGLQYGWKGLRLGLSSKNLAGSTVKHDGEALLQNQREYILNLSYAFRIGQQFEAAPFLTGYRERNDKLDAGLYLSFRNLVYASYLLRVHELRSVYMAGANVYRGWGFGLAYDRSGIYTDHNLDMVVRYQFR